MEQEQEAGGGQVSPAGSELGVPTVWLAVVGCCWPLGVCGGLARRVTSGL